MLAATFLLAWAVYRSRPAEPVYQGRRLGEWLRGHPRDYHPAVRALGTNALPFLMAELQATDSGPARFAEKVLGNFSIGPLWRTASDRRYRARLGLQILDTSAAPALVNLVLAKPMKLVEGDPAYSAASALDWLASSEARAYTERQLLRALTDPEAFRRRNACLASSYFLLASDDPSQTLFTLTRDTNAPVRAAAVRALLTYQSDTVSYQQTLISCLEDEEAVVRQLAVLALRDCGANATAAIPALRHAYTKESSQPNLRGDLNLGYFNAADVSPEAIRSAILQAIKAIDPKAPVPAGAP